ncbi:TRAUB-domain-containing protein [Daldinia caldariorum]|uniref:TRAUB-domain-containing protein n=1 Tax=Daldinia caldariorum TaxID=326644 RepID=UPI002007286C|nr:TRAUB-domain-containing protein [Daldinia caldariorum]KAI1473035.1 TRAUB-domain-containing protein [Daldinia caldariorum]
MSKTKGRARQFAEWVDQPVKDFDPEAEILDEDDASGSEESIDENAGTEHYVSVGKSKLRRRDPVALGPQYRGAPVSREALEDEDEDEGQDDDDESGEDEEGDEDDDLEGFDDPDTADLERDQDDEDDAEIDSENAFDESDEQKFKDFVFRGSSQTIPHKGKRVARPTAADYMVSDEEDDESDGAELNGEVSEDMEDEDDTSGEEGVDGFIDDEAEESEDENEDSMDEDEDEDEEMGDSDEELDEKEEEDDDDDDDDGTKGTSQINEANRSAIQEMMNAGQRTVASTLSTAAQKDVAKGKAVRQQRKAFDALLNIRIRLQKSLVAVNSFSTLEELGDQSEPYEAAEAAALKLWNTIDGFRTSIQSDSSGKTGQKRKRAADADTSSQDIWENMKVIEQRAIVRRRAVLEKWSHSARNIRMVDRSSRKFTSITEKSLTTRLDEELDAPERLIKRTRTPRSCAPAQVAKKINEDPTIYDDADFYQLLLKELVDQRTGDASGAPGGPTATIRFAAVKEAKAKRHVDTKASKGRKMRFNIHDKLQNFMAPEDRRSWEQSAIDRFFGTLFGQKLVLNEDEEDDKEASDEEMGGAPINDGSIRLFRD